MTGIFSGLMLTLNSFPASAGMEVVPAPAIGLGLPAIAALLVVGMIALLLKYTKI